jgi:hypothetical protein
MEIGQLDLEVVCKLLRCEGVEGLRSLECVAQMRCAAQQSDLALVELGKQEVAVSQNQAEALAHVLVRASDEKKGSLLVPLELTSKAREKLVQE